MFFDTAACIVVKGTMVDPGSGGGKEPEAPELALGGGGAAAAEAGAEATLVVLLEGAIPALASTSAAVIRPNGPVPTTDPISILCCFANFFA